MKSEGRRATSCRRQRAGGAADGARKRRRQAQAAHDEAGADSARRPS